MKSSRIKTKYTNGDGNDDGGLFAIDLEDFSVYGLSANGGHEIFFNGDLASGFPAEKVDLPVIRTQAEEVGQALSIQPNQSEGLTSIVFSVSADQRVTLAVFDMSGRVVEVFYNGISEFDGNQRVEFDGSYLPNGLYLVKWEEQTLNELKSY